MDTYTWYTHLIKPIWAPPAWLFGPVWTILYMVIILSFGNVFYNFFTGKLKWSIAAPFALNLVFNLAFTPIQFGLKNNLLATIDILFVLVSLVYALLTLWHKQPNSRWIILVNIPYLLWVTFATYLQINITYLNK